MTTTLGAVLAFLSGTIVGSFLNVVAYRLPRKESLSHPPSRCPHCGEPVKPYDNVPVLSWLVLRGRCRHCKGPISPRYPLVELGTGLLCALVVVTKGADRDVWLGLVLVLLLVPIALIDLDHRIIPNKLTGPGAIVAVVLLVALHPDDLVEHLIAAAAAGGFLLVTALVYPAGMGMGDVKLVGMLGLFLGAAVAPAVLISLLLGSAIGAVIIARKGAKEGRKTAIPFGPYLAIGGLIGLYAGQAIVDWYVDKFF
jgi:leader peptidase (prepilin peptidase)/N-methyltransferase